MKAFASLTLPALALLAACSPPSGDPDTGPANAVAAEGAAQPGGNAVAPPAAPLQTLPATADAAPVPAVSARVIGLEGLGDLRIGQALPAGGSWASRGAQTGDACRTVSSLDYPGVYAIVSGGKVRRISVGQRSDVKLVEGIGVGATEREVAKWFAGFREAPHAYQAPPAKYLTAPNTADAESALRFEIGSDGKVSLIHVGTMPELAYVEGCS